MNVNVEQVILFSNKFVKHCPEIEGDMTIRRVANRSFFRLEINIERLGIFLATDAKTVSTSEKYDRHLSWSKCKKVNIFSNSTEGF